jgi:hypothetical protein
MTRERVEAELLTRLEFARTQYEKLKVAAIVAQEDAINTSGNADGDLALSIANGHLAAVRRSFLQYRNALRIFNRFIRDGTLPESNNSE